VRKDDTVGRQGGDEFVVVLSDLGREDEAALVAEKILGALAAPLYLQGRELFISASVGVAIYPRDGQDTETLIKAADTALFRAKDQGRNTYCFFTAEMNANVLARLELERDLRHALERNELVLHYQPQYSLADGRIIGAEALVRWRHPERGLVSPAKFIPIAEETGLIEEIGAWVLHTACTQMQSWRNAGSDVPRVAINLSARQFHRRQLAEQVASILGQTGLPPDYLELELTESMLMHDAESAADILGDLKRLGVSLAVDDFGTGYSSLAYLKRFPIDRLKIDRSFVCSLPEDQEDAALVRAIVSLAGSLALEVIAEGVETVEQRDFLRARGCDLAQGYLFAAPMAAEDLIGLLSRNTSGRPSAG
jgi:predicted signal transduction protein with EAL and GGDEF domain